MLNLEPETLNLIIESLPTGTIVADSDGKIVLLNQPVEKWFGYHRDELLGQSGPNCLFQKSTERITRTSERAS